MISILQSILDDFICFVETGIILFANLAIKGVASVVKALISLLPSMPSSGDLPTWVVTGYHYAAYWFPVDWSLALAGSFLAFYLAWLVVAIVLRWGKVISGAA